MLSLNTNLSALFAANSLNNTNSALTKVQQQLATGKRINNASDDPAGLVIATNLQTQIKSTAVALNMANNTIATATLNDGYASQIIDNLQKLNAIAVQNGGTASGSQATALIAENARLAALTTATGSNVVDGKGTMVTGVGLVVAVPTATTTALIQADIAAATTSRALYGADMTTFQSAHDSMSASSLNMSNAYSKIMDVDYGAASAEQAKLNILQQAGTAMLAQANQMPSMILQLLR